MKLPDSLTTVTPFSKLLAMLFFILFPFVGFYLGMIYQYTNNLNTQPQQAVIPNTNYPAENIDNWQAYVNYVYGFGFKYPNSYLKYVQEENTGKEGEIRINLTPYIGDISKIQTNDFTFNLKKSDFWLEIQLIKSDKLLDEYVNNLEVVRFYLDTNRETITVGGQKAYRYINPPSKENVIAYTVLVKNKSFIYDITMNAPSNKILSKNRELFDTFISTFKFTQ